MRSYGVAQALAVANQLAVDENHHMLPDPALLVEHIPARSFVLPKVVVEHRAQRGSGNLTRRALDVALNVSSESNRRHIKFVSVAEEFALSRASTMSRTARAQIDSRLKFFLADERGHKAEDCTISAEVNRLLRRSLPGGTKKGSRRSPPKRNGFVISSGRQPITADTVRQIEVEDDEDRVPDADSIRTPSGR